MTTKTTADKHTLEQVLLVVETLVPLLIRSGFGHAEFAAACKSVFYRQALLEAERTQQKSTDSAISLLSGLHRRDTANLRKATSDDPTLANPPVSKPISVPKQVVSLWLSSNLNDTIPIHAEENSFSALVATVSKDQHHRSILNELQRLGIVDCVAHNQVQLKRQAYTPNPQLKESKEIFAQNVADHVSAGLHNIFSDPSSGDKGTLEQAVFSDELTQKSIRELNDLANQLWFSTLDTILKRAIELHTQDQEFFAENAEEVAYRFRLGMYAYHTEDSASFLPDD